MSAPPPLRLLASTNNARGDLFTRLTKDLFYSFGYDELRMDVHKSGRELDVQGAHRRESKSMVAECKARTDKIGGDELNKFFGALTRERDRQKPTPVVGYFVSISGFRETGREQELETSQQDRVILLDGPDVVDELERSKMIVTRGEAIEKAGRCALHNDLADATLDGVELLGHELGYIWAVFYSRGKERTHVALIHADGTPLATRVAEDVLRAAPKSDAGLSSLCYLQPPSPPPDRQATLEAALNQYLRWLEEDCGYIQLDGLPADSDLSAVRMTLERLFVPLKILPVDRVAQLLPLSGWSENIRVSRTLVVNGTPIDLRLGHPVVAGSRTTNEVKLVPAVSKAFRRLTGEAGVPVGRFLADNHRFSLLAQPGGGKSTLLKRIATAYGRPSRRVEIADDLPDRAWLPLLLRCRDLRESAHRPVRALLGTLGEHAGMNESESRAFRDHIDERLRSGEALLLIDGLDEISDEGARSVFAQHLRTFLSMFPHVGLIVTSREAGFRHVAGVLGSFCQEGRLASFDEGDVERLCVAWHAQVVGETEKVRSEAESLARKIWQNERIRALAENPLLLTTLLVVRRSIGELPTRRVALYGEAVRVLIRTWNTEGFEPMDLDEALTQLCYVACAMLLEGKQRIEHENLLALLRNARIELEAELHCTQLSPEQFIERIEYRSSLLMQTGVESIDGKVQPIYEFRHLTFQEYLAARGFVEEKYPGRDDGKNLADLLDPHFADQAWREVIPLAAVLAGRKAEGLVRRLMEWRINSLRIGKNIGEDADVSHSFERFGACTSLLRQCLADEVQVPAAILRSAFRETLQYTFFDPSVSWVRTVFLGRLGPACREVLDDAYWGGQAGWDSYISALIEAAVVDHFGEQTEAVTDQACQILVNALTSRERLKAGHAACVVARLAEQSGRKLRLEVETEDRFWQFDEALRQLLDASDPPLALTAVWALAAIGLHRRSGQDESARANVLALYRLWRESGSPQLRYFAGIAFSRQPLLERSAVGEELWGDCDGLYDDGGSKMDEAKLMLAWYRGKPWTDADLGKLLIEAGKNHSLLELGVPGPGGPSGYFPHREMLKALDVDLLDAEAVRDRRIGFHPKKRGSAPGPP
ncbi:MAG: NACHT domain-containing protein [Bryobacterales bacterium]|nr:NACHT domain-containing protein [Bryobacterales bacterium]